MAADLDAVLRECAEACLHAEGRIDDTETQEALLSAHAILAALPGALESARSEADRGPWANEGNELIYEGWEMAMGTMRKALAVFRARLAAAAKGESDE